MKISIILISTFLVILLISFTIFIFFYLNNFLPREVIKKIKSNLKKITSYKNKIKLYSEQFSELANKNLDLKNNSINVEKKINIFRNICLSYEFTSNQVFNALKIHLKNHSNFELKCLIKNLSSYNKSKNLFLNIGKTYKEIINYIEEKILFPQKIQSEITNISLCDKKINELKISPDILIFFTKKIENINNEIIKYYDFFNNDIYMKKSHKWTINKLSEFNDLMQEKLSIYSKGKLYYSLINNFIPETIAKILSKHNITNLLDNSTEIEVFNKKYSTNNLNFILSSFKNSLKYLDFSKNIEFEKRLKDIFVDLELALIKLQFMQKTKSLLSIIVNQLEYFFETIKNEIEYVQRKIKNVNKTLKLNNYYKNNIDYINNEFANVEFEIEEINKMNNNSKIDASILSRTKNVLISISNILYENEKISKNIDDKINEKNIIKNKFLKSQKYYYFIISLAQKFNLNIEREEIKNIINQINEMQYHIIEKNIDINNVLKNELNFYIDLIQVLALHIKIEIESAKITKLTIKKIAPFVSENEELKDLYSKLIIYNANHNYFVAIDLIEEYTKEKIN